MSFLEQLAHQNIMNLMFARSRQIQKNQAEVRDRSDRQFKEELVEENLGLLETQVRLKRKNDALLAANQKLAEDYANAQQLLVKAIDCLEVWRQTANYLQSRWEPQDERERKYKENADLLVDSKFTELDSNSSWPEAREGMIKNELEKLKALKKGKK